MKPIDFVAPIFGLALGIVTFILVKRNKSKPKMWPRILGTGVGVYMFLSLMTASILLWSKSEFMDYTIDNFLWSLVGGVVGYVSGRIFARRFGKE